MRTDLEGSCHCGNIEVRFSTEIPLDRLAVRACSCSFCRRHGARTATDPAGEIRLRLRAPAQVSLYQFGLRASEFVICSRCGTYVAAIMKEDGRSFATVNVNNLFQASQLTQPPTKVSYDNETEEVRRARRRASWTPLVEWREG